MAIQGRGRGSDQGCPLRYKGTAGCAGEGTKANPKVCCRSGECSQGVPNDNRVLLAALRLGNLEEDEALVNCSELLVEFRAPREVQRGTESKASEAHPCTPRVSSPVPTWSQEEAIWKSFEEVMSPLASLSCLDVQASGADTLPEIEGCTGESTPKNLLTAKSSPVRTPV